MYKHKLRLESLSPQAALELLKEGNARFVQNLEQDRNHLEQINETKDEQHPFAVILSCIDSRTSAELIFDQGLGDVLSIRIAGNVVNDDILGSIEFGCKIAGAKIIVVLGHTNCSAVRGACNGTAMGHFTGLLNKIHPSVEEELKVNKVVDNGFIDNVSLRNVVNTVKEINNKSSIVNEMIRGKQIMLIGGLYDLNNGKVSFIE
ncbi:MAG: carbonic anhydrase [Bacteroidota bacterium]|nr:carbonic anhydrase [Bacteroidota bacterium]